jgi:C-5 cytosine-specific DNA methylase
VKPLMIDLFCGLGGATEGFLAEGWHCIGIDNERHRYGNHCYPSQLWIQDILTVDGAQLRDADFIWASPPCQAYSWMAMPWSLAKAKAAAIRADATGAELERLNALFNACFRIQREASEAAGRHIPMIVENVRGAQPWVGRARWSFGSFYLWGDVPALMPVTFKAVKVGGKGSWSDFHKPDYVAHGMNREAEKRLREGIKNENGGSWDRSRPRKVPSLDGTKNGNDWFGAGENCSEQRRHASKSPARKMASAMIAKIPEPLSRYIARHFKPALREAAE